MAGKGPNLSVLIPKRLQKGSRSSVNPTDTTEKGTDIRQAPLYPILNNSVRTYRNAQNITQLLRHMARLEGPFATAVHNMVEVANNGHVIAAYDAVTHEYNPEGTLLATTILESFGTLYDYSQGYTNRKSIESLKATALREVILTGAACGEMVLNDARLPDFLQLVGFETLLWKSNGKGGGTPYQRQGQKDIDLNIPTFWVSYLAPDPNTIYARSMMEAAIKQIIYFEEFMEDIRRSVRVSGHNRTTLTLDSEKIKKLASPEVQADPDQLQAFFTQVRAAVEDMVSNIDPEQAYVMYDSVKADVIQAGTGTKQDYTPLLGVIAGQYATSMKTPPSALGLRLESGSQALGNVETLIFLKSAKAIQTPVEEMFSRALTLSARLYGANVYVRFEFDALDLRPEIETEAYQTMRQTRILEQLSLGFITDDEAAMRLKTGPRPAGAPPLSGTMFMESKSGLNPNAPVFPGDTAMGRTLKSDQPEKAGGASK
jgi:hypothetical protein